MLHLLASPVFSGPAEALLLLARAQRQLGHQVTVAIDRKRHRVTSEEPALPRFVAAGLLDDGGLELSVKSTPWAMAQDVLKLRRRGVDVVHAHFSHDHVLARLATRPGRIVVRSFHAPRSIRASAPRADGYTVPALTLRGPLPEASTLVLPALVDPVFAPPVSRASARLASGFHGAPLIGMVSTFQPSRRHLLALDAFCIVLKRHPDARLVLAGDGTELPRISARIAALGLTHAVSLPGYLPLPSLVALLQSLDELWVLGLGNDYAARVAAQAAACGVRVVAVDEGALAQYADALIEPDATALAAACQGARRPHAVASSTEVAEHLLALYQRLLR